MSIEAMKQAREVIRIAQNNLAPSKSSAHSYGDGELWDSYDNAMNGLDQAIAEIKKQEVVAEMMKNPSNGNLYVQYTKPLHLIGAGAKFYTSPYVAAPLPTQRPTECKPLTDEEIADKTSGMSSNDKTVFEIACLWAEAKLKEKNT